MDYRENCYSCLYGTLLLDTATGNEVFGTCNVHEEFLIPLNVQQFRKGCKKNYERK